MALFVILETDQVYFYESNSKKSANLKVFIFKILQGP